MGDAHDGRQLLNLRLVRVGRWRVLFCAEVDAATSSTEPKPSFAEIKASDPRYFEKEMKVLFQMLSSGSETLVYWGGSE